MLVLFKDSQVIPMGSQTWEPLSQGINKCSDRHCEYGLQVGESL